MSEHISGIGGGLPRITAPSFGSSPAAGATAADGAFGGLLDALQQTGAQADAALADLAVGGDMDLHDVVLAVEVESIAFELATQLRNRLVCAYQEIFRMNV